MNDNLLVFAFIYLFLASGLIGFMPDSFFTGSKPSDISKSELGTEFDASITGTYKNISFLGKVITFMFVPIFIDGIPLMIAWILEILHLLIFLIAMIYGIKIVRGVST